MRNYQLCEPRFHIQFSIIDASEDYFPRTDIFAIISNGFAPTIIINASLA
jgi:hypothetical protein